MLTYLDLPAIRAGALVCLVIATPAAIIISVLADDGGTDQSNWVYIASIAVITAYILGGAKAGRHALDAPFVNGAAATFLAFVVVQVIGGIVRVVRGEDISTVALVFNALLAASIGAVGAWFGARRGTLEIGGGEPTG